MASEANLGPRTHDDYTVGWVCALPKEQTAAIAMLDHRHADLPKPPNDPSTYTLGSINDHNIVIACLPKGKTGTNSAANVAACMVIAFPSIKVGLMVGIGGGVPPRVRLGDVVVSTPTGQFPGVVQWDLGKAKEGGKFERTGSLNNPPTSLLSALTRLETEHELNGSKIPEYLDQLKEKWPRLVTKYLRSNRHEDVLFRSDYGHVSEDTNFDDVSDLDDSDEESCKLCDKSQSVKKKPREMRVHYGLIASGNQVIKDATLRNTLNKDLDGQVLCIEMEAAGLMNNFPCIVIRGICDYADSHKNNVWQEHAAAIAAAFAKEFLGYVQTSEVERELPAKDMLQKVLAAVSATGENTAHIRAKLDREEDIKILDWLTPTDYGLQQSDYFQRWQPGTGRWLLDSKKFRSWLTASNQTLFCPGMPGAGKTILASTVVDHLISELHHENTGIAYIYCNFRRHNEQNTSNLLASILKQLAETQSLLPESVKYLHTKHEFRRTRPSIDEIRSTLQSVIASYSRVFIVIDALDECQTANNCRTRFLSHLFDLQIDCRINIFATSRPLPEIYEKFTESIVIEVRAHDDDVRRYLDGQISHADSQIMEICRTDIKTKITEAVKGMFLLAQLYFEVVKSKRTQKKIKDVLKHLPIGHRAYDEVYEEAMKRIMSQNPDTVELARLVLSWITCAERPLKTVELQHALAVEAKKYHIDEENLLPIGDMVSICSGLVTIDKESGIIRLIHYTTHEYLSRTQERWLPEAESAITTICNTYLLLNDFKTGPCKSCMIRWPCIPDCEYTKRIEFFPLYHYAAIHWGHHARRCLKLDEEAMSFLNCKPNLEASLQVLSNELYKRQDGYFRGMTGLHLASYLGVSKAVSNILQHETSADPINCQGKTPLSIAAQIGHKDIVELLLSAGKVNPDSKDEDGRTPLSYAAGNGHRDIAKLLLGKVRPDSKDKDGRTPLSYAAGNGHERIIKLLLATGKVDPDSKAKHKRGKPVPGIRRLLGCDKAAAGRTPLSFAAGNGHEGVITLLLTTGKVYPDSENVYGRTSLSYAAGNGHEKAVKSLLGTGKVNPDSKSRLSNSPRARKIVAGCEVEVGRTPLSYAAGNGHERIVKLLLAAAKVDPDSENEYGQTSLSYAAGNGHEGIVKLLLATGKVNPKSEDEFHGTPISYADRNRHKRVVELLLATLKGDITQEDLYWAAARGYEFTVKLLLATGKVDLASQYYFDKTSTFGVLPSEQTPLSIAMIKGHVAIVRLFVTANISYANMIDNDGRSLLTFAAIQRHGSIVKLLLARDVTNVNIADKDGRTPLSHAAEWGRQRNIKLMLATGKVNKNTLKDKNNLTPLLYAAKVCHKAIVKLFLTIDIPIGSTYGYEKKVCDSASGRKSLKRLIKRHIRAFDYFPEHLKQRRRELVYARRPGKRT